MDSIEGYYLVMSGLKQAVCAISIIFLLCMLSPIIIWPAILAIANFLESFTHWNITLVGEAGGLDPGALITTAFFVMIGGVLSWVSLRAHLKVMSFSFGISSVLLAPVNFGVVSSIIWL